MVSEKLQSDPAGLVYKRVLLKISGEALMGEQNYGIDVEVARTVAEELKGVHERGVQVAVVVGGIQLARIRRRVKTLKLGRDGERAVGQFLERLRVGGARIYHDIPGDGFNLDHVVIAPQGLFVIETKTWAKRSPNDKVVFDGTRILVGGRIPSRDPVRQIHSAVDWLRRTLEESTGKRLPIRGVVVFPGWFVNPMTPEAKKEIWVLEPKALPSFIEQEPVRLSDADMALAAFHLGRYVRTAE